MIQLSKSLFLYVKFGERFSSDLTTLLMPKVKRESLTL